METRIEILVDLSTSMKYPLFESLDNGEAKIEITKKLLIEKLIPTIDFNSRISLHTFTANEQDEEANIITIIDEDYISRTELAEKVNNIGPPNGWTPIAAAIDFSVKRLKSKQSFDKKIILLTDGEENCNGDYLESAKQAANSGVNCKIFIIGIGELTEKAVEEFEEIAKITDGKFVNIGTEAQEEEEKEHQLQDLFQSISLDTIFNIIDSHYESNRAQNLILCKVFKDHQKNIFVIPNKIKTKVNKQDTLIIEFYDSQKDYNNLGKALTHIKNRKGHIERVILVLKEWNQENENIIRKYCPLIKGLGISRFDIKILGLPLANPKFVKNIFESQNSGNIINIIGDHNFVNTGTIQKYNEAQTQIILDLVKVIKTLEENNSINESEKLKYIEQLHQLTREVLKDKKERLPKSILDLILLGLGPLDSLTSIWVNVREILKSHFEK